MTPSVQLLARLQFLCRVAEKELRHLQTTDRRLFGEHLDAELAARLDEDVELAERVEAFVGRFGRLQDLLADKLLPALLTALGERVGPQLDNLDLAERLGYIATAEMWFTVRQLRNHMVHEYIEDPAILADALQSGHDFVPFLTAAVEAMVAEVCKRGWNEP